MLSKMSLESVPDWPDGNCGKFEPIEDVVQWFSIIREFFVVIRD